MIGFYNYMSLYLFMELSMIFLIKILDDSKWNN